jgi:hypothetical protein
MSPIAYTVPDHSLPSLFPYQKTRDSVVLQKFRSCATLHCNKSNVAVKFVPLSTPQIQIVKDFTSFSTIVVG